MRHRIIATVVLLVVAATPVTVLAQESPAPDTAAALERALLERLCSVGTTEDADMATCLLTAADALSGGAILGGPAASPAVAPSAAAQGRLEQARQAVEEALSTARQAVEDIDLQAAVDDAVASAQDVDLRAALDEAVAAVGAIDLQATIDEALTAATEVDVEAALSDAMAAVDTIDLQAALDDALAPLQDAVPEVSRVDVEVLLAAGVLTARMAVAEAQAWAQENSEALCSGGSLSVGAAVAVVVAHLTGDPVLAVSAFRESERLSGDVCTEVAQ